MDNKDEKTFTDLFSSSKEESEIKTQTFSDILNNSIDVKENEDSVTFDSLFDQIGSSEEQIEETNILSKDNVINNEEDNTTSDKDIQDNNEMIENSSTSNEPQIETSSLFDETPPLETTTEEDPFMQATTILSNNEPNENDIESNINPFIDTNEPIQESNEAVETETIPKEPTVETNPFFEETSIPETTEKNPFIEETTISNNESTNNDIESKTNPFIDTNEPIQESNKAVETETIPKEPTVETNPFFGETSVLETTTEENPFIGETPISNNASSNNDIELNTNPFIDTNEPIQESNEAVETETIPKEPTVETNPFFGETSVLETTTEENQKEKELENITPKSTSPFFEEEKKSDENPFFQNQLNLVENKVPDNPNGTIDASKSKHYNVKIVKKKEPLIKLVLGVLSYALFIWLLLIGITLLVYVLDIKIRAAKEDYSSPTFNAYVVLTGSMLPEIEVYDVVVTKKIDAKKLKEGDVITFASADTRFLDTIITHRIIKKNPPNGNEGYTFQTQGDNNNVADSALVPENRIFGKVILKIPKLGYLQEFLASRGGWIIVILIPCLTVISYDTVKLIKGLKRKKYKNIKVQK